jgi:hypothetical protein
MSWARAGENEFVCIGKMLGGEPGPTDELRQGARRRGVWEVGFRNCVAGMPAETRGSRLGALDGIKTERSQRERGSLDVM